MEPPRAVTEGIEGRLRELGEFIREQRRGARMSLRGLSERAGISNPYLSQIERGLRRPSADILQRLAKALRVSAESLYVRAGILEEREGGPDLEAAILADATISESQQQALLQIYRSFQREHVDGLSGRAGGAAAPPAPGPPRPRDDGGRPPGRSSAAPG